MLHVLQDLNEIGIVQLLEGRIDESAVDVGVRDHLGFLEHGCHMVSRMMVAGKTKQSAVPGP